MARMKLPQGTTSVGCGGMVYIPDKSGVVEVSDGAVTELLRHGLVPYFGPPSKEESPTSTGEDDSTHKPEFPPNAAIREGDQPQKPEPGQRKRKDK